MFRLTNRLALSNLIKNRKLYYPFALASFLAIAITYIFTSLTLNPHLDNLTGADAIKMVLGMGLGIVALSSGIIVLYANSFVIKNRSKEQRIFYKNFGGAKWNAFICRHTHMVRLSTKLSADGEK